MWFLVLPITSRLSHPDEWALSTMMLVSQYECVQLKGQFHCCPHDYEITSHTEPWDIFFYGQLLGKSQNYGPVMHSVISVVYLWYCTIVCKQAQDIVAGEIPETWDDSSRHLVKWNVKPRCKERRQVSHDGSVKIVAVVEMWQTASSTVLNQEATNLGA